MAKVQDTYNPLTGEYVKRISDWIELTGDRAWGNWSKDVVKNYIYTLTTDKLASSDISLYKYDSSFVSRGSKENQAYSYNDANILVVGINETGFSPNTNPSSAEAKAYFYGWRQANSDGTSPYYKSEVPYTPATWAEWGQYANITKDVSGLSLNGIDGAQISYVIMDTALKSNTKYGVIFNIVTPASSGTFFDANSYLMPIWGVSFNNVTGNQKYSWTTDSITTNKVSFSYYNGVGGTAWKLKDIRVFEIPTGSQIEADFNTLTADQLSAKYTFNGLCIKNWKKVTDGTGLTSTLPTASYAGYTPYRMIYQLANPEISYLTPKATIPLYDKNTIVETDTPSDCKADVTVGYKLKDGVTAVAGDITAPTPDYMSAVNSVSEDGLKKGIVRSPNLITNGNFANGTTGWSVINTGTSIMPDGTIKLLDESTGYTGTIYQIPGLNVGDILYARVEGRCASISSGGEFGLSSTDSATVGGTIDIVIPVSTTLSKISSVFQSRGSILAFKGRVGSVMYEAYLKSVFVVNLTASFGAGNEPTKEQCDILFATWQDKASTQATLPTLRKIGTVADTYNPETGVLVQRIGKKVLRDTDITGLSIVANGANNIATTRDPISPTPKTKAWDTLMPPFYSTHFTNMTNPANTAFDLVNKNKACISTNGGLWLSVDKTKIANLAEAKEWVEQQYTSGTPIVFYYELATPVVTTLATTALPTYKPTTVIESDSTIKGNVSTDYKLKVNATPVAGDFIASPECVNDIKDLGNSIDVVSSNKNKGQVDLSAIPYNTITNGVYKTNILLSAPLRSVGAVKDRLFKDSDGKWKVERNVREVFLNGAESFYVAFMQDGVNKYIYSPSIKALGGGDAFVFGSQICSHSQNLINPYETKALGYNDCFWVTETHGIRFRFMSYLDVTSWKAYLSSENAKGTPVTIQYKLLVPTYEVLSQELQTKLDNIPTFPEHNYVYTVANDNLQPTLHVDYKKLSWLKSRLLLNSLKIYSRNLTDAEMIQNYKVEKERFGM